MVSDSSYSNHDIGLDSDVGSDSDLGFDSDSLLSELSDCKLGNVSPEQSAVIVMKGYPFTRKTEFANIIAKSLGCPVLSSEDFIQSLTPPLSSKKEFGVFKVICNIALHHLNNEIFKNVVIDAPLSSKSHLIHLINRISLDTEVRLIVIECKSTHPYSWKLKFEEHLGGRESDPMWYKAKKWEDVEKAIAEHPDYDFTFVSSRRNFVSKLVVDPLLDCPIKHSRRSSRMYGTQGLVEAVNYMRTRVRGDGLHVVVYREWLQSKHLASSSCSTHGHYIVPDSVTVEGIRHEIPVDCMVCEGQVIKSNNTGGAYCYCKNCGLTLHMECATTSYTIRLDLDAATSSFDPYACKECKEGVNDKSIECNACLFTHHVRFRGAFPPVVIQHFNTKQHFLILLFPSNRDVYRCFACGKNSNRSSSVYMYLCTDCGVTYHYECVTMPRRVKNVHGGHHHHLSLKFESEEAEDYICQECQEYRDPALWYYSCEDCPGYQLHPCCVAKLRKWKSSYRSTGCMEWMDKAEIEAAHKFNNKAIEMRESESISDFYSRVIYPIQWYGDLREEVQFVCQILLSLPLKFYHIVVAILRSKQYESMTVDQLMISLRVYEKRIDNGEDVLIEQVLANLYATQRRKSKKWRMNMSLESALRTDYSKQESGENWVKHWGKYWDKYWFNYSRGYYRKGKSGVQCFICKMFGHSPRHCWSVSKSNLYRTPIIIPKLKYRGKTKKLNKNTSISDLLNKWGPQ